MSIATLTQRLQGPVPPLAVPPVPSVKTPEGTEEPFTTQCGSPGSPGSPDIEQETREPRPYRLWLIVHADGRVVPHAFTPPATEAEVRSWYPQALTIEPKDGAPAG